MKTIIAFTLIFLISCQSKLEKKNLNPSQFKNQDELFQLDLKPDEKFVRVIPPENSDFALPDSLYQIEPSKLGDFNADGKEDILINFGACGTGGCMAGIFLNQFDNYYKLAFMDYLKNVEYKIEKNGLWTIQSSEALRPYDPSEIQVSVYKFDENEYFYKLDTTYLYIEAENDK